MSDKDFIRISNSINGVTSYSEDSTLCNLKFSMTGRQLKDYVEYFISALQGRVLTKDEVIDFAYRHSAWGVLKDDIIEDFERQFEAKDIEEKPTNQQIAIEVIESLGGVLNSYDNYEIGKYHTTNNVIVLQQDQIEIETNEDSFYIPYGSKEYLLESFRLIDESLVPVEKNESCDTDLIYCKEYLKGVNERLQQLRNHYNNSIKTDLHKLLETAIEDGKVTKKQGATFEAIDSDKGSINFTIVDSEYLEALENRLELLEKAVF